MNDEKRQPASSIYFFRRERERESTRCVFVISQKTLNQPPTNFVLIEIPLESRSIHVMAIDWRDRCVCVKRFGICQFFVWFICSMTSYFLYEVLIVVFERISE